MCAAAAVTPAQKECVKRCTTKYLKLTNRIGQQMAEKQMVPGAPPPAQ